MAPMAGIVTVIGASGFVGRHVVARLVEDGHVVRAVSRHGRRLPGWGDQVRPVVADVESGAGIGSAVAGADAVVHLVAIPRETGHRTFARVNVDGVAQVCSAMRSAGVRRLVHVSVLGVTDDARYRYLSSRWRGEELVRSSGLDWTILRPSLLFGAGDGFFSLVATTLRWWSPGIVAIPAAQGVRFQPLAVSDLAVAVAKCVAEPARIRETYELGGPQYVTYPQIVDAVMAATGMRRLKLQLPVPLLRGLTTLTDRVLPIFPVSHDQVMSLDRPNHTDLDAFQRAFGAAPSAFDLSYMGDA
jgi:uncharacterized protein YbjT (DUF2867 family)